MYDLFVVRVESTWPAFNRTEQSVLIAMMNGNRPTEADDTQAVKELRKLVIDICRQNGGGHGGSAIGMAPMAVALWKHVMRYNPQNSEVRSFEITG